MKQITTEKNEVNFSTNKIFKVLNDSDHEKLKAVDDNDVQVLYGFFLQHIFFAGCTDMRSPRN